MEIGESINNGNYVTYTFTYNYTNNGAFLKELRKHDDYKLLCSIYNSQTSN